MKAFILYYYSINTLFRNSSNEDSSRLCRPSLVLPLQTHETNDAFGKTPVRAGNTKNSQLSLPWKSKVKQMLLRWRSGYQRAIAPTEQLPTRRSRLKACTGHVCGCLGRQGNFGLGIGRGHVGDLAVSFAVSKKKKKIPLDFTQKALQAWYLIGLEMKSVEVQILNSSNPFSGLSGLIPVWEALGECYLLLAVISYSRVSQQPQNKHSQDTIREDADGSSDGKLVEGEGFLKPLNQNK